MISSSYFAASMVFSSHIFLLFFLRDHDQKQETNRKALATGQTGITALHERYLFLLRFEKSRGTGKMSRN